MTGQVPLAAATARLRAALEETAAALAAADLDRLLRGELALQLALEGLTARPAPDPEQRAALRIEIDRVRRALDRCRRLGDMLRDLVRAGLDAQGRAPVYGRPGGAVRSGFTAVDARG